MPAWTLFSRGKDKCSHRSGRPRESCVFQTAARYDLMDWGARPSSAKKTVNDHKRYSVTGNGSITWYETLLKYWRTTGASAVLSNPPSDLVASPPAGRGEGSVRGLHWGPLTEKKRSYREINHLQGDFFCANVLYSQGEVMPSLHKGQGPQHVRAMPHRQ